MLDPTEGAAPASQPVTLQEMDALAEAIYEQDAKIEEMKKALTEENKKLASMEQKFAAYLTETGRKNFKSPQGTISFRETWRFNLPKTDEAKSAFFDWLKAKGIYEQYITVNSTSFNSLLLAEWKAAQDAGEGMFFAVPGVEEPKMFRTITYTKGK